MPLTTGAVLANRYRAVQQLGEGESGAVYRGWDINLQQRCAIKESTEISEEDTRQSFRETQTLVNLSHSNLARVLDYFIVPKQGQYLVMDFVDGEDLGAMLAHSGPVPEDTLLPWMGQVADALHYLHSQNPQIIHREVKPANIRITPQGKAVLVGFGMGRAPGVAAPADAQTSTPEQELLTGITAQSDIYALGATMYTLLTGQPPQGAAGSTIDQPPAAANPSVSQRTSWVVMKALESDPGKRFQSVLEMKRALNIALDAGKAPVSTANAASNSAYAQPAVNPTRQIPAAAQAGSAPGPAVQTLGKAGKSGAARGGAPNTSKTLIVILIILFFLCIGLIAAAALLLSASNAGLIGASFVSSGTATWATVLQL